MALNFYHPTLTDLEQHELDMFYQDAELNTTGGKNMATLKDEAKVYEPQQTKNIADLKEVSVNLNLEDRKGKDKNGEEFSYKVVVVDGEDYRVPGKVLGDLKSILEKKPTLTKFAVSKKGVGLNTQYTVIPLD